MSSMKKEGAAEENKDEEGRRSADEEDYDEATKEASSSVPARPKPRPPKQHIIRKIPEAVDDFLRNFLRRLGLTQTLDSFEAEWYGPAQKLLTDTLRPVPAGLFFIPDALTHRQLIQSELETVRGETDVLRREVLAAGESLVRMRRERDFHRLQYRRVAEDKNKLIEDFKQLKKHLESYEPALKQLDDKYQAALKQKMLLTLEKDRVQNTMSPEKPRNKSRKSAEKQSASTRRHPKDSQFSVCSRPPNLHPARVTPHTCRSPSSFSLSCSINAHKLPISCIDLHPRKLILASASDDRSWRLWALPTGGEKVGQMVLTGEDHSDWLSGCSFHPDGSKLATTSGDATVRLWDFSRGCCVLTLSGHSQPTWCCSFHSCGHFLASCSADKTAKLWDLNSQRCRLTLRRHTASVNSIHFLPFSNLLLSCSSDKSLSLWDARLGVCTATFQGHQHPCNHATFDLTGEVVASCDTQGVIKLWDVRMSPSAVATVDAGPLGANQVAFSPSGKMLAVAGDDGLVRLVEVDSCRVSSLAAHRDGVQSVTFDHKGETVISAGNDGLINVWS